MCLNLVIMVNVQLNSSYSPLLTRIFEDFSRVFINSFSFAANNMPLGVFQMQSALFNCPDYYFVTVLICPLGPTLTTETKAFLMFEMEKALETLNLLILVISKVFLFLFLTSLNALGIYFTYCVPGTVLSILPGQTHSVLVATL